MRCSVSRSFHIGSGIVYIRSHSVVFLGFFQLVCAAIVGGSALPMGKYMSKYCSVICFGLRCADRVRRVAYNYMPDLSYCPSVLKSVRPVFSSASEDVSKFLLRSSRLRQPAGSDAQPPRSSTLYRNLQTLPWP